MFGSRPFLNNFNSKNPESLKYWFQLLYTKPLPEKYYIDQFRHPLLYSDEILPTLHHAFDNITDPHILKQLVRVLHGRTDTPSINIMIRLLRHPDYKVSNWAAHSLQESPSPQVAEAVLELLSDSSTRNTTLIDLAILNHLDSLHPLLDSIYLETDNRYWKKSAIKYFSAFPLEQHKKIFRTVLAYEEKDVIMKRDAALGLGRLKDKTSVDLIIKVCEQESATSDFNAYFYLMALGMIKGDQAQKTLERYKNSSVTSVRNLVTEMLEDW